MNHATTLTIDVSSVVHTMGAALAHYNLGRPATLDDCVVAMHLVSGAIDTAAVAAEAEAARDNAGLEAAIIAEAASGYDGITAMRATIGAEPTAYARNIGDVRFSASLACEGADLADMVAAAAYAIELAKRATRDEQTGRAREALCAAIDHARAALAMLDGAQ